jgi:hypothetical protein
MSVRRQDGIILLEGHCSVEDAEPLARLLEDSKQVIDWTGARRLHTAVVQMVLQAGLPVQGPCGDSFVARWIEPGLVAAAPGKA